MLGFTVENPSRKYLWVHWIKLFVSIVVTMWGKDTVFFLKPKTSRRFFISENGGSIEFGGSGSVPFREYVIVFADGVDQIIERLNEARSPPLIPRGGGIDMFGCKNFQFEGLERADDLQHEGVAVGEKMERLVAED